MPTFLFNLRQDSDPCPFLASVSIVDPIVIGFRGLIRRFKTLEDVTSALDRAGIASDRYGSAISSVRQGQPASFSIDQNEAQKLDILQTDTTE